MQLILQDADKAQIYGLPAADTTVEAVRAQLAGQGFSTDAADAHLNFALSAGVYRTASMSADTTTANASSQAPTATAVSGGKPSAPHGQEM